MTGSEMAVRYSGDLVTTFTKGHPDASDILEPAETISLAGQVRLRLASSTGASLTVVLS